MTRVAPHAGSVHPSALQHPHALAFGPDPGGSVEHSGVLERAGVNVAWGAPGWGAPNQADPGRGAAGVSEGR